MNDSIHILLVEDEEAHAELIRRVFEAEDKAASLVRVRTLAEARAYCAQTRPDLVIGDLILPDGKGLDLLPSDGGEAAYPVVLMTSYGNERVAVEAIKAGALDYIVKSGAMLADLPRLARRALREWGHIVEHRRAEQEIHRRNRELTLLNRIIAASVSNLPEEILETVCRELGSALDVQRVMATLLQPDKSAAVVAAEYLAAEGQAPTLHTRLPVTGNAVFQYLLANKAPLIVDDVLGDTNAVALRERMSQRDAGALLVLPVITAGGEVMGSLELEGQAPRHFSNDEINLAWSVADQLAIALTRAQLNKERRQLTAAIEQTAESVVITDTEGVILYVNPTFERTTGYSRSEIIGQNTRRLKCQDREVQLYQEMWAAISAGEVWHGRLTNCKRNGSLFVEDETITPVRDENGVIVNYVAVKHDVTRELQLEQQYLHAQKMEAIGRLTAGIAHDFNNLLTVVNGFATLLQQETPAADRRREAVDRILTSGQRAAALTRQLLAFSRKQYMEPRVVALNSVVEELDKMLHRIIGEDIDLKINLAAALWPVRVDPTQVDQVILNLVINARDAMPQGGQVIIETANVVLDREYTRRYAEVTPGDYVMLAISDSGTGMTEEVKQHLFEPFFTTKEVGKGTGLGLATVFGIVKQSGGSIWVYSEAGQGTTFKIYLPRLREISAMPLPRLPRPEWPRGGETILVVEDEPGVQDLAVRVLRRQGYTVLTADNGVEAVRVIRKHEGDIELVLTDVIMPGLSGKVLADQVRLLSPRTKVLFTSGYTDSVMVEQGLVDSRVQFIQKPFSPVALVQKVREVLDGVAPPAG